MKLDLGCNKYIREGYIGIDKYDFGQKHILDLETDKLPYDDNSIDVIYANHFLEHLKDTKHCLNECWRVLKKGGILEANSPYGLWERAQRPNHFQCITPTWFHSLSYDNLDDYKQWKIKSIKMRQKYEVQAILIPNKG